MPLYPQRFFNIENSRDRDCHFERTWRGLLTVFHLVNAAHPREGRSDMIHNVRSPTKLH
jgi:hypothetical protein